MGNLIAAVSRGGGGAWVPTLLCLYCMHACAYAWPYSGREGERQEKVWGIWRKIHIEPARRAARRAAGSRGRVNMPQLPFSKVLSRIQKTRGAAIWVGSRDTGHWRDAPVSIFLRA